MGILAWLLGSSLGRKVALTGMAIMGVLFVVWRIYAAGKAAERARQAQASLENMRKRIQTDDEITKLSPDERRRRLAEWVRDGG